MTKLLQIRGVVEEQASLIFVEWVRLPMSRAIHKHSVLASRKTSEYTEGMSEASLLFIDRCRTTTSDRREPGHFVRVCDDVKYWRVILCKAGNQLGTLANKLELERQTYSSLNPFASLD